MAKQMKKVETEMGLEGLDDIFQFPTNKPFLYHTDQKQPLYSV